MSKRRTSENPFWLQNDASKRIRVDLEQTETIQHELFFEDDISRLQEERVYIGRGIHPWSLRIAIICAFIVLGSLLGRAGWMQIVHGDTYRAQADANRFRREVLPARRGIIRDSHGLVLAENIPSFHVRMRWIDLPQDDIQRADTVSKIARLIGTTSEDLKDILLASSTPSDEWVDVAKDVPYERAIHISIAMPELTGVSLIVAAKRQYPYSAETPSLSHLLGYVGSISPEEYEMRKMSGYRRTDEIGKTGVERTYETELRGTIGERRVEVDAFGRPRAIIEERESIDGGDITLTIAYQLQEAAERALVHGLEKAKVTKGSVVVMDVRDGSILALVSWPSYDNNLFAGRVSSTVYDALTGNPDQPLFPRAWRGQFPSGSVIKPLIALAALEEGIITPQTTVVSVGGVWVGPWFFPDWLAGGHGATNVRRAIAWSVNTFFYYVGAGYGSFQGLGVDRLTKWMTHFGLGEVLGIDLPGEATGHVPSQAWKEDVKGERWYIGDTYNLSIGQGDLLVTPLQIARVTSAIANGGSLVEPHVVAKPHVIQNTIKASPDHFETVRSGMRDTVLYGSGRSLSSLPVTVAGKTGTAQWRSDRPNHAWFTGFAPYDDPQISVTVLVEEGVEGSSVAVPIASEIFRAWNDLKP